MKKSLISTLMFSVAILAGCSESEATQTVNYYKTHDIERKAMLEKCRNEMGVKAAADSALDSVQLEGFSVPEDALVKSEKYISGEINFQEFINRLYQQAKNRAD